MKKINKYLYIIFSILLVIPSIFYLYQKGTTAGFNIYFDFLLNKNIDKKISTTCFIVIFILLSVVYLRIIKEKNSFKNIKELIKYVFIVCSIFLFMLPWTSSDIFYYMGVGELDSQYGQNPYYITIEQYYSENSNKINDEIMEQAKDNFWANTTVVYGPISQIIFKLCTKISNKKIFSVIYGLNPSILLEFIGNMHNDTILVAFILLAIYFIYKKNNLKISILFLALSTGMKYFSILLLPFFIIYYYRDNKKITYRFIKCIQYGIIFLGLILLEYLFYFQDYTVLIGIITQTSKYSKSIYSAILLKNKEIVVELRYIVLYVFYLYYIKVFTEIIFEKNIKWRNVIKKCNNILVFSMLLLTTFQQWYLIWLFTIIMWQNNKKINRLLSITIITELANAIYMYKSEWYIYDGIFVMTIICLFILNIFTQKILQNFRKEQKDEKKQKV